MLCAETYKSVFDIDKFTQSTDVIAIQKKTCYACKICV